ncbi:MAG: hypothetical protein G01um101416_856 [Microgenomates group bacterium Gr01-1014_16]|nr:MAG: hypothetical protein G01um101416_856 [Microgenomates group bacterium Gr01-1014_16]
MKTSIITITTDLGDGFATSQLKVIVAGLGYDGQLVENHDVEAYSIVEGAYGIWQLAKFCPPGTIHVGIVDPGVGSERAGIVIKTKKFWFVGPDNGLLYPAASADGIEKIWRVEEQDNISNTFHGRDVFIKLAVRLAQGEKLKGVEIKDILRLEFKDGQVLHIDHYGNAKVWGKNTFGLPLVKTFSDAPVGTSLILNGSSDLLELAVNLGSAQERFGLKLGEVINEL